MMSASPAETRTVLNRAALLDTFRRTRERSSAIFDVVPPEGRLARPISLRHPIVFYEGHIPAFYVNTIIKKGLGQPGVDEALERLFARGIDPEDERAAAGRTIGRWPVREALRAFVDASDRLVERALETVDLDRSDNPVLDHAEGVFASLEHEAMHQETLLYILHCLPYDHKRAPVSSRPVVGADPPAPARVSIPAGRATLGADAARVPFGWDNEFTAHTVDVPAFGIGAFNVTNRDYLQFVEEGGYRTPGWWSVDDWAWRENQGVEHPLFWNRRGGQWMWRGLFEAVPLPLAWPVYITHAEASAYARWKSGRLPTEAEFHRAAFGTPEGRERPHPWGDEPPGPTRGNFDFEHWDPVPVGAFPAGVSAWGVHDLVGNGWEWTSTVFRPFAGFRPMASYPEYSADFFDGRHYVLKGASPATAGDLVRASFRNWFRPQYPYVYATFRVVYAP
jgi:gamma-glutamyl hercynylcysteine S-oxide synthase